MQSEQKRTHQNVIEILVAEEVEKQLKQLPSKLLQYIEPLEVETYALNRLPPLYASSEEGKRQQNLRAKNNLSHQIATAVRQGIAAVQRDPLRLSTPLMPEYQYDAYAALEEIRECLEQQEPSGQYQQMIYKIEDILTKTYQKESIKQQKNQSLKQNSVWDDDRYIL